MGCSAGEHALFWLMPDHWLRSLLGWTTVIAWVYCINAETHWTHILFPHRWTHSAEDQLQISPDTGAVLEADADGIKNSRELWESMTDTKWHNDQWMVAEESPHPQRETTVKHLKLQEGSTIPQFVRQSNLWKWSS